MVAIEQLGKLESRNCPVCGAGAENAVPFLRRSVDPARLTAFSYASRKTPERMSFELATCQRCSTVYASAAPTRQAIADAYQVAAFNSADEAALAAQTYAAALAPILATLPARNDALEIGTGTGAFLSALQQLGFANVTGVEPSHSAIEAADRAVRPFIRESIFVETNFAPESFDLICCFMTLEHVLDPRQLVEGCSRLLRKGGLLALVTHDYRAPINRLLGRFSPIIDIEHLQIFCEASLNRLLTDAGLRVAGIESFSNRYPISYWLRLAPLPAGLKALAIRALSAIGTGKIGVSINVGNLLSVGRKTGRDIPTSVEKGEGSVAHFGR